MNNEGRRGGPGERSERGGGGIPPDRPQDHELGAPPPPPRARGGAIPPADPGTGSIRGAGTGGTLPPDEPPEELGLEEPRQGGLGRLIRGLLIAGVVVALVVLVFSLLKDNGGPKEPPKPKLTAEQKVAQEVAPLVQRAAEDAAAKAASAVVGKIPGPTDVGYLEDRVDSLLRVVDQLKKRPAGGDAALGKKVDALGQKIDNLPKQMAVTVTSLAAPVRASAPDSTATEPASHSERFAAPGAGTPRAGATAETKTGEPVAWIVNGRTYVAAEVCPGTGPYYMMGGGRFSWTKAEERARLTYEPAANAYYFPVAVTGGFQVVSKDGSLGDLNWARIYEDYSDRPGTKIELTADGELAKAEFKAVRR